jgi:ribose/xylose/arabinose/galactoside ABC-type transport system permease subunit
MNTGLNSRYVEIVVYLAIGFLAGSAAVWGVEKVGEWIGVW